MGPPASFRESHAAFLKEAQSRVERYNAGQYRANRDELPAPWPSIPFGGDEGRFLSLVALARLLKDLHDLPFVNDIVAHARTLGLTVIEGDLTIVNVPERLAYYLLTDQKRWMPFLGGFGVEKPLRRSGYAGFWMVGFFSLFGVEEKDGRFEVRLNDWVGVQRGIEHLQVLSRET